MQNFWFYFHLIFQNQRGPASPPNPGRRMREGPYHRLRVQTLEGRIITVRAALRFIDFALFLVNPIRDILLVLREWLLADVVQTEGELCALGRAD